MRISILASGSRGDVQPYVALGVGLRRAGHSVQILSTVNFRDLVTGYDLEFAAVGGDSEALAQSEMITALEQGNLITILQRTGKGAQQIAVRSARDGLAACRNSDLLISGLGAFSGGFALAEKLNIPFLQAHILPLAPNRAYPSALLPGNVPSGLNRASHVITRQMMWQMLRGSDNIVRADVLDLPRSPFWGPKALTTDLPILYGYSRHVLPPDSGWPANINVTGYWFLEPPQDWQPPTELLDFLEAGPPPVYIGFGSMPSSKPEEAATMVIAALKRTGQRGILYGGWGGLKADHLPENVRMVGGMPHSWLFSQMAALVHHGGAGTTAAGLRAGVPSIITPFFGDQPFWGRQIAKLGVGPQPIPRRRLTSENLSTAIDRAVNDPDMRRKAAALGAQIRAEDGVARAVEVIEAGFR